GAFRSLGSESHAPRIALRVFRPPRPAQVSLREGIPVFVSGGGVRGAVQDVAGPWRASGDWWDVAWSREEWDVALAGGVYRIFRDRSEEHTSELQSRGHLVCRLLLEKKKKKKRTKL